MTRLNGSIGSSIPKPFRASDLSHINFTALRRALADGAGADGSDGVTIQQLAHELLEMLRPGCERIEIAGGIRRGKAEPKDIELVAVPAWRTEGFPDLFGEDAMLTLSCLDDRLAELYTAGAWELDHVLRRNGPKYKRLRHIASDTCCDLFIVTPETFGAQFVIRTGPADFSHMLVALALRMGMKQDDGRLWRVHRDDTKTAIETPEERDYFAALGMEYIEPELRGKVPA